MQAIFVEPAHAVHEDGALGAVVAEPLHAIERGDGVGPARLQHAGLEQGRDQRAVLRLFLHQALEFAEGGVNVAGAPVHPGQPLAQGAAVLDLARRQEVHLAPQLGDGGEQLGAGQARLCRGVAVGDGEKERTAAHRIGQRGGSGGGRARRHQLQHHALIVLKADLIVDVTAELRQAGQHRRALGAGGQHLEMGLIGASQAGRIFQLAHDRFEVGDQERALGPPRDRLLQKLGGVREVAQLRA